MAILSRISSNWMFSLKVLLISTAVLSLAVLLKSSVPAMLEFIGSELPGIWSSLRSWLTPPYLYFIINGIIITIAASSRFHHKVDEHPEPVVQVKPPADSLPEFNYETVATNDPVEVEFSYEDLMKNQPDFQHLESLEVNEQSEASVSEVKAMLNASEDEGDGDEDGYVISRSTWTPKRRDSMEYTFVKEKPLASSRFANRKSVKASPEGGKALGVAKPKRHDTLESTWKTITEGRPIPLARHLKKSETWETHGHGRRNNNTAPQDPSQIQMKSATFRDRTSINPAANSPSPGKLRKEPPLRKEPSLGQDELNKRVEAFINKFNEDMRLQRQESLNQYMEMVRQRAH